MNSKLENVKLELHRKCCKFMKFERYLKGETVFHSGDTPDKFYIILSGIVNVFLPKSQENILSMIDE